jgi:glyoxylase-like metal-dependent hydrolase (beta-lactamase superfamily II)
MAARVVPLGPGVWRLPTLGRDLINSFAFEDIDGSLTLVDAGLRGATRRLLAALAEMGRTPDQVTRILITHAHLDHVGSAKRLRATTGGALQVHTDDAEFVRQGRPPPHDLSTPLARVLSFAQRRQPRSAVDATVQENDVLPVAGGVRVLHTPGHSPGHCSFLHESSGVLITGDALFNLRRRINYSSLLGCTNYRMSQDTADRLGEVHYEIAAFTHGSEIRHNARDAVRAFLRRRLEGG